ncbi:endo-1,4-beta-xylanase, partial [Streptomyces eurythermus]
MPRSRAGRMGGAVTTALLAATMVTALSHTATAADGTLGSAAAAKGRYFGTAVAANHLGESAYAGTLDREFNA